MKPPVASSAGILAVALILLVNPAYAQSNWASVTSVTDLTGNAQVPAGQPLIAGHSYNVTISVAVPFSQSSSQFQTTLDSRLLAHGSQFWYVKSSGYGGYNASAFNAGQRTVVFKQVQGSLVLSSIFEIPTNLTTTTANGFTLHYARSDFPLISVSVTGGSVVGGVSVTVQDQTILTYLNAYQQKSTLISSGRISPIYSQFVNGVVNESQAVYKAGLPDLGTALLDVLNPSAFPAPPSSSIILYLTAGVVALAVIAAVFALLAVRSRGKAGYAAGMMNEAQRELASLEVTASKFDKNLADSLKTLRDKLGESS